MNRVYAGHGHTVSSLPKGLFDLLQQLLDGRDDSFAVLEIVSGDGDHRQIDCALFSPGGIDVIEIKDKKNPVIGSASSAWKTDDGGTLNTFKNRKNGRSENPYMQAENTALDVLNWLSKRPGVHKKRLKVYPLVLIPFAAPGCKIGPHNWVRLALGLAQLPRELRAFNNHDRVWEPEDYVGLPAELGLIPIDLVEITGQAVDRSTGKALQRVQVETPALPRPLQVDTRGNFSFTAKPGQSLTLRLRPATTHEPLVHTLEIPDKIRLIELGALYFDPVVSKQSVAHSEREVLELQAQVEALTAQHAKDIEKILNEAQRERNDIDAQIAQIQRRYEQEARTVQHLASQRETDLAHVHDLERRVADADKQLAALDAQEPAHQARVNELQAEREELLARTKALQSVAQRQEQQADEAERRAAATMLELAQLQDQLPAYQERIESLEQERAQQQAELTTLRAEHSALQDALAAAAREQADHATFTEQLEAARQRLDSWMQRSRLEKGEREAQFRQREAQLQEELDGAMARLAALSARLPADSGSVMTRAVSWQRRTLSGVQSPMVRSALTKLNAGESAPGNSLPERPTPDADPAVWNLPPESLLPHMRALMKRWEKELPLLSAADQTLRRSLFKRVRDAAEDLEDSLECGDPGDEIVTARQLMSSLLPGGPANSAPEESKKPSAVRLSAGPRVSDSARPWVLHGGVLQDLETGDAVDLIIPGIEERPLPAELNGMSGLRDGDQFTPVWALEADRQVQAWLPDSWSAVLSTQDSDDLIEQAAKLTPTQFRVVCRTVALDTLLTWTGHSWPASHLGALHEAVLARFEADLQAAGIPLAPVQVQADQVQRPLQLGDVEAVHAPELAAAHDGVSVPLAPLNVNPLVVQGLPERVKESGLYLHQALSLHLIRGAATGGYDVVLSTPTASGKTMAFLPGVLEGVIQEGGNALFLYPLRALSADQLRTLKEVQAKMGDQAPRLGRHFGAEEVDLTSGIPRLLVATPDKLNSSLDRDWCRSFLAGLRYIVLDEAHTYRGPFGANMSGFLRRLLALCPTRPTLILSSATLQNTIAFAQRLTGRPAFRVAGASTAPRFPRHLYVAPPKAGRVHRSHLSALRGFGDVVRQREGKGLIFAGGREAAREISRELRHEGDHRAAPTSFAFYSGMKDYDSELERLRDVKARPLIAASTSTLEAGVDIGDIDMVSVVGFPRSRNSFKQMVGRAGRVGTAHIAFLPGDSPADVYYSRPETLRSLLARESEPVYLNPHNPVLALHHVERARYEAECAGRDTGPALLRTLFPEGLHREDREALIDVFDHAVRRVRAPLLRGNGTDPHVVVQIGGPQGRHPAELNLTWQEGDTWLLERLGPEAAYREWPMEGRISRGDQFFRVVSWRRGTLQEGAGGYAQSVVIIGVHDITDDTLAPGDVLACRMNAGAERSLPPGAYAPRMQIATTKLQVLPAQLDESVLFGPVDVACGTGHVSFQVGGLELSEQVAEAVCEVATKPFATKGAKRGEPAAVEVRDRDEVRQAARLLPSVEHWKKRMKWREPRRPDDPLWTAYTYPQAWTRMPADLLTHDSGSERRSGQPLPLKARKDIRVLQVGLHEHALHTESACTCARNTVMQTFWIEGWTPVQEHVPPLPEDPRRWEAHDPEQHSFTTEVARITLTGGGSASRRAVMLALVKAIPDLLEVDPQEFGVGVESCPDEGGLELIVWDATPGGTGVTHALRDVLPALIDAARSLLTRTLGCTCEGTGCFGCILPLERIHSLMTSPPDDPDEALRIDQLVFSRFAAGLDVNGAIALCTETA